MKDPAGKSQGQAMLLQLLPTKPMLSHSLFPERLRAMREKRAMTRYRLAQLANIDQSQLMRIEQGKDGRSNGVTLKTFVELANKLGCSADELLK